MQHTTTRIWWCQ